MSAVDWRPLEDALYRQGRQGFLQLRELRPHDRFYSFAFYTTDDFAYLTETASSLEGLEQAAARYSQEAGPAQRTAAEWKLALKWSPCDSPWHGKVSDLTDLSPLLQETANRIDEVASVAALQDFIESYYGCFFQALRRLDQEGLFGVGRERAAVVVNILKGDQSDEERISFAEQLNPPAAVALLKHDLELARNLLN